MDHTIRSTRLNSLRRAVAMLAVALVAACVGPKDENGDLPVDAEVTIEPDPAVVLQGDSLVLRVDVIHAGGEVPTAYEIDLDEAQSKIDIRTAPCPAALGRPACQEWTITPAADSVPGSYDVAVRTVGLSVGVAGRGFQLRVVARPAPKYGAATAVAAIPDHVIVVADGLLYASGDNRNGESGVGYLYRPFASGPGQFNAPYAAPRELTSFVPVQGDPARRFVAVAVAAQVSYAVDVDGRVHHWGTRSHNLGGVPGPLGHDEQPRLSPTGIDAITGRVTAVSSSGYGTMALGADGFVTQWGSSPLPERVLDLFAPTGPTTVLAGVRAIAGDGFNGIFLLQDGTVRSRLLSVAGLPAIDAIALGVSDQAGTADHEVGVAVGRDGSVWWWPTSVLHPVPRRDGTISDATAIAFSDESNGVVLALRRDDPGVWVWRLGADTPARSLAPPAGRRFVKIARGYAILDDCGADRGSLWRIHAPVDFAPALPVHGEPLPEFGVGGPSCPAQRADTNRLTVGVEGAGRVISEPAEIDCGGRCEGEFRTGSTVRLHAVPELGWRFIGWRAPASDSAPRCTTDFSGTPEPFTEFVAGTVNACVAVFEPGSPAEMRLTVRKTGSGRVTSDPPGVVCGASCSYWFETGSEVRLVARPERGYRFDGFSGDEGCADAAVSVKMNAPKSCEASFVLGPPPATPADFRVTTVFFTSIGLAWTASAGVVDAYRLERSTADGAFVTVAMLPFGVTQHADAGLTAGTAYTYRLTALGPGGAGVAATVDAATVPNFPLPPQPPVVFQDAEFAIGDWLPTVLVAENGATQAATRPDMGGNPSTGAFRQMTHRMPASSRMHVVHLNQVAVYSPAAQGAIAAIDCSEDRRFFAEIAVQATAECALEQDGRVFRSAFSGDIVGPQWTNAAAVGLQPQNFVQVSGLPCTATCPDFSAAGAPITFGYFRATANPPGRTLDLVHGIDNWRVTVHRAAQ